MNRIIVIGSPGAGKSFFARKLRDMTGLPLYYLDKIYHKPDRNTVTCEEFDRKLLEIMQTDNWIIDGNYQRTLPIRFGHVQTFSFWIILWSSAWKVLLHESVPSVRICHGLRRNLIPNSGSIY